MIDLDKLKKLCALANNNPNENEANLAARKVCKMLEEGKFQLGNSAPIQNNPNYPFATHHTCQRETVRKAEPARGQNAANPYYTPYDSKYEPDVDWVKDFFRDKEKMKEKLEWFYRVHSNDYINVRTGEVMSSLKFNSRKW